MGILVVAGRSKRFMLPGGGANRGETRENAAKRKLEHLLFQKRSKKTRLTLTNYDYATIFLIKIPT